MPTNVYDLVSHERLLEIARTSYGEMQAELDVMKAALDANDAAAVRDRFHKVSIQANWVFELVDAWVDERPRTVKSRLEHVGQYLQTSQWLKRAASARTAALKSLAKKLKKAA
jgi:hypothetical protein